MAMWMTLYYWGAGLGFWIPLGYIGHVLVRNPDIANPLQVAVGLIVHLAAYVTIPVVLAIALPPVGIGIAVARGIGLGIAIWLLMQYVVLNLVDPVAYRGLIAWVFAVAHIVYGALFGFVVSTTRGLGARVADATT